MNREKRGFSNLSKGFHNFRSKLRWHIEQLIPRTYRSCYVDGDGDQHFCVWRMWFGRVFDIEDKVVVA